MTKEEEKKSLKRVSPTDSKAIQYFKKDLSRKWQLMKATTFDSGIRIFPILQKVQMSFSVSIKSGLYCHPNSWGLEEYL